MSAKHTPGPLKVVQVKSWPFDIQIVNQQGCVVFLEGRYSYSSKQESLEDVMTGYGFPKEDKEAVVSANEEQLANAYLRAAAPDLLEALRICEGNITSLADSHPRVWAGWLSVVQSAIAKATGESK
jgi:hypothetical protein